MSTEIKRAQFSVVKIVSQQGTGKGAQVTVDGVDEKHLTGVELKLGVGATSTLVLHHIGPAVDFEGLAKVVHVPPTLEERVRAALERVQSGNASMRIPADPTDPDLVLADVLKVLELARSPAAPEQPASTCACPTNNDPVDCMDLRVHGHAPGPTRAENRAQGLDEACSCSCHDEWFEKQRNEDDGEPE